MSKEQFTYFHYRFAQWASIVVFLLTLVPARATAQEINRKPAKLDTQQIALLLQNFDASCSDSVHPESLTSQFGRDTFISFYDEQLALIPHLLKLFFKNYPNKDVLNCFSVAGVHPPELPWKAIEIVDYQEEIRNNPELFYEILNMTYGSLEKNVFAYFLVRRVVERTDAGTLNLDLLESFVSTYSGHYSEISENNPDEFIQCIIEAFLKYVDLAEKDQLSEDSYKELFDSLGLFDVQKQVERSKWFNDLGFVPDSSRSDSVASLAPLKELQRAVVAGYSPNITNGNFSYPDRPVITSGSKNEIYLPTLIQLFELFGLNSETSSLTSVDLSDESSITKGWYIDTLDLLKLYMHSIHGIDDFFHTFVHENMHNIFSGKSKENSQESVVEMEAVKYQLIEAVQQIPTAVLAEITGNYGLNAIERQRLQIAAIVADILTNERPEDVSDEVYNTLMSYIPTDHPLSVSEAKLLWPVLEKLVQGKKLALQLFPQKPLESGSLTEVVLSRMIANGDINERNFSEELAEVVSLAITERENGPLQLYLKDHNDLKILIERALNSATGHQNWNLAQYRAKTSAIRMDLVKKIINRRDFSPTTAEQMIGPHQRGDAPRNKGYYALISYMEENRTAEDMSELNQIFDQLGVGQQQRNEFIQFLSLYRKYRHLLVTDSATCIPGDETHFISGCESDCPVAVFKKITNQLSINFSIEFFFVENFSSESIQSEYSYLRKLYLELVLGFSEPRELNHFTWIGPD